MFRSRAALLGKNSDMVVSCMKLIKKHCSYQSNKVVMDLRRTMCIVYIHGCVFIDGFLIKWTTLGFSRKHLESSNYLFITCTLYSEL